MIKTRKMDLQLFGDGGDGGAAGTGAEGSGSAAEVRVGDVLEDGREPRQFDAGIC